MESLTERVAKAENFERQRLDRDNNVPREPLPGTGELYLHKSTNTAYQPLDKTCFDSSQVQRCLQQIQHLDEGAQGGEPARPGQNALSCYQEFGLY